jgi:putative transposase
MTYNLQNHHRRSIRLKQYDYSQEGLYFIAICTKGGGNSLWLPFGKIENGKMMLNEYGQIARNEWIKTTEIRNNVELGEFVIMQNHIHGIIRLFGRGELHLPNESNTSNVGVCDTSNRGVCQTSNESNISNRGVCDTSNVGVCDTSNRGVCDTPLRSPSQTIGAIVRGYKSSVTRQLGLLGFNGKLWQRNYYEHVIRDEKSYLKISEYIQNNPANWHKDSLK